MQKNKKGRLERVFLFPYLRPEQLHRDDQRRSGEDIHTCDQQSRLERAADGGIALLARQLTGSAFPRAVVRTGRVGRGKVAALAVKVREKF